MDEEIKLKVINQIELLDFYKGEYIIENNSSINFMGYLNRGKLVVKKKIKNNEIVVKEIEPGEFFG